MAELQKTRTLQRFLMASILLVGFFVPTIFAQQTRQRNPTLRRSVSFPTSPTPTTSFYPVMRAPAAQRTSPAKKPGGWVDLGNGARMRVTKDNETDTIQSELSPEVLQTLRNLKEQNPKPRYQLNPTPITGAVAQPLEDPAAEREELREIGATESKISFPPEKNIRIQALDFRNTSVQDALRSLAQLIRINLMLSPGISGNVTILFSDVTL